MLFLGFSNYVRLTSGCAEKHLGGSATPVSTLIGPRGCFNQGMVVQQHPICAHPPSIGSLTWQSNLCVSIIHLAARTGKARPPHIKNAIEDGRQIQSQSPDIIFVKTFTQPQHLGMGTRVDEVSTKLPSITTFSDSLQNSVSKVITISTNIPL